MTWKTYLLASVVDRRLLLFSMWEFGNIGCGLLHIQSFLGMSISKPDIQFLYYFAKGMIENSVGSFCEIYIVFV